MGCIDETASMGPAQIRAMDNVWVASNSKARQGGKGVACQVGLRALVGDIGAHLDSEKGEATGQKHDTGLAPSLVWASTCGTNNVDDA
jgi:hypothetical protein